MGLSTGVRKSGLRNPGLTSISETTPDLKIIHTEGQVQGTMKIESKEQLFDMINDSTELLYASGLTQGKPCVCDFQTDEIIGRGSDRVAISFDYQVKTFDQFMLTNAGKKLVLKQFLEDYDTSNNLKIDETNLKNRYAHQAMQNSISKFLAYEFSRLFTSENTYETGVTFLNAYVVKLSNCKKMFYNGESPLPPNKFEKYTNNTGYIAANCPPILIAFSLFTHQYTDGLLMVTDLQGYYEENKRLYVLTDPAIQCKSLDLFDKTNLGEENIERCFEIYSKYYDLSS